MYSPPHQLRRRRCDRLFLTVDPIVAATGAATLCTALSCWLPRASQEGEVVSEAVCWVLLALVFGRWGLAVGSRGGSGNAVGDVEEEGFLLGSEDAANGGGKKGGAGWGVWVVAGGIAGACCYRAEVGELGLFVSVCLSCLISTTGENDVLTDDGQPMLTPLLLVADRKLRPESRTGSESGLLSAVANTTWGPTLVAVVAVFAQSSWDKVALALSVLPVSALLVAYTALIPRTVETSRFLLRIDVDEGIAPLSLRIAALLAAAFGAQAFAFGVPSVDIVVLTLALGLAKAFAWYFTIQTVCGLPKLVVREC